MLIDKSIAILRQLGFALRSLRRSPGFTLIAVVTLGAGIGASTFSFSMVNEVLLRPLPYPDSDRLERLYRATPQNSRGSVAPADYLELRTRMRQLKSQQGGYLDVTAAGFWDVSLSEPGKPAELVRGLRIADDYLSILGVAPQLGRNFRPDENVAGNHRVLIISNRYWAKRFAADAHVIGRTVRVDGQPHVIVGVLPRSVQDWRHLGPYDLYRPLALDDKEKADRTATWLRVVGRRSGPVTHAQATALIDSFGRRVAAEFPAVNADATWRSLRMRIAVAPDNGPGIFAMVIGLSCFVLLIACSNLANLLLARTMGRARELAVRAALGASHLRLLRALLAESLLLALGGGALALGFVKWSGEWFPRNGAPDIVFAVDWRVLGWAFAACLLTVVAFGVAPALFALRLDLNRTLKSGSRGTTADRGHRRFRNVLIVGQFAFALILLAGGALFMRGARELNERHSGWQSAHLVSGTILLPAATYPSGKEITQFQRLSLERLEALPGVASASVSYSMPFLGLSDPRKYLVAGLATPQPGHEPVAVTNGVSPHYFETVGTRVVEGRTFDERDTATSPKVFVVNQAMARGLFGDKSPLGRRIAQAGGKTVEWGEVVGVVGDIESIYADRAAVAYQLYQPMAQEPRPGHEIAVRTAGIPPSTVVASILKTMATLDADLPVSQLQPADVTIATVNKQWDLLGTIISFLAVVGVGLASLGIYGVIARTTAQRSGEFGIRLAVGALAGDIVRLVLASGAKLALVGTAIGLVGAIGVSRLIGALFPAMHTNSAAVLSGVTFLLLAVALLACYVPARSASRISPSGTVWGE